MILENVIVNYLILWVTAKLSKNSISNFKLMIGSLIGALYLILFFMPDMKIYYTAAAKFLLSVVIVAVAFSPEKIRSFVKTLAVFYIVSFIFAGSFVAFSFFADGGGIITNGIIYTWNPKWTYLAYTILILMVIIRVGWNFIQNRFSRESLFIPLSIVFEQKKADVKALIDTGNSLHDPISNIPVIIVEFTAIRKILPEYIQDIFTKSKEPDFETVTEAISNSEWVARFRLIPFTSIGKEYGMLIGFKPDYISIRVDEEVRQSDEVIVGIYNRRLSKDEDYSALLCPELVA